MSAARIFAFLLLACRLDVGWIAAETGWRSQMLHNRFASEGAASADIDGDGHVDLVAGSHWFAGPEFTTSHQFKADESFPVAGYSNNFFCHVTDVTNDGRPDILIIGFPGKPARLFVNPGGTSRGSQSPDRNWAEHSITDSVDNESPRFTDLIPGGAPELVCGSQSMYGYYQAGKDATQTWTFHPISRPGACPNRFMHGLGVGDVDGDGRMDILDKQHWWQQPNSIKDESPWQRHTWNPDNIPGGSQVCVGDIDGDGDADLVSSIHAHGYGLAWFEQSGDGPFIRHDIMGESSQDNPYGIAFSQLHAVALRDVDGDGLKDIVTGKRYLAHNGKDAGGLQPPVLYWFRCVHNGSRVEFVPHKIHGDSGVGTEVLVEDLNDDQRLDIVTSSKRGLFVHIQDPTLPFEKPERWSVTEGRDQSKYTFGFEPDEAAENMIVPDGFHVDLIASEPDLTQPIAMCFDAKGRIWVVEGHTYPQKAPEGQGKDRVVIFEDTDANGTFETKSTFIEGLNLASAIEVGFGGVWIGAAPELLFIPDADHDGKPDGEPQVLLDGWGYHDTHETMNSFTWGPDGQLYGCQGVFTHSNVGKPGASENQRTKMNAGVWRYHPTRHVFEVFAHGTSNPWGVDFNQDGEWFISSCVIPHLFHIVEGGRYHRQAGRHFNKHTYDDIKTIADHAHFAGRIADHAFWGDNKINRPAAGLDTSMLGGGHAHCGLAIYDGDVFPPEYRGDLFFHNLHGHRVVREHVEHDGSGFVGRHRPDFGLSQDHHQVGVGIMVGPDGALYTSDWHDEQTCHMGNPEVWDRSNGRMFRIRYGDVRPVKIDLWNESNDELQRHVSGTNGFLARQAGRILRERGESIDEVANILRSKSADELALAAKKDQDRANRRKIASHLQRMNLGQRWPVIEALTSHSADGHDRNIPYLVWYGLEPLVEVDPDRALTIAFKSGWRDLPRFVIRRTAATPDGRQILVARLADDSQARHRGLILEELLAAAKSRGGLAMPNGWAEVFAKLRQAKSNRVIDLSRQLAVQFGDADVMPHFRDILVDPNHSVGDRRSAMNALVTAGDPTLADSLLGLIRDNGIAADAVAALGRFDSPKITSTLIEQFSELDSSVQSTALSTLASREASAISLIDAMENDRIEAKTVPAHIVRRLLDFDDKSQALTKRLETTWGRIVVDESQLADQYAKYRKMLGVNAIRNADIELGRKLYEANCGKCHKLGGEGGVIGPELTGANRTDRNYWLQNILQPNALIGRGYQVTKLLIDDGRVISGILKDENQDAVTVVTADQTIVVKKSSIEERTLSDVSLMPAGQLETMSENEIRSLFKYLMGSR